MGGWIGSSYVEQSQMLHAIELKLYELDFSSLYLSDDLIVIEWTLIFPTNEAPKEN